MEESLQPEKETSPNINPDVQHQGTGLNLTNIDELKHRLEQQKANKLKAEQLVSTLSRIKAREKASRKSTKLVEKKVDDGSPNQPTKRSGTNVSNTLKEKSNLLKKKLEEDRAKLESKRGQEDLGKVSEIVEHIRVQLEDQDKTIQQLHSNIAATNKPPPLIEENVPTEPELPPEVKQKIADLEMKILDLQENVREKDSVISARTQAISLLSEDMARKGKNTLDTLEETRSQMKMMQSNFVALEDRMNEERVRLREELENKKQRIQQIEKNFRTAESARFDLSTRVAELQEKIVSLQTKNISLEEELGESKNKAKEFQDALENSNKQTIKIKAQFKAKLKALEEERDSLKKEAGTNDELNRLQERITELEEEKEAGVLLKERVREMEDKLQRQESDLDSHVKAITSLEADKLDLIEAINSKNILLKEKDDLVTELNLKLTELNENKISVEMKCLELEEKLDSFKETENELTLLNDSLETTKLELTKKKELINDLTMKLESQEAIITSTKSELLQNSTTDETKNIQGIASNLEEWQTRYSLLETKLNETLSYCKELEEKKTIFESHNEKLTQDCLKLKDNIDRLNEVLSSGVSVEESSKQALAQKDDEILSLTKHSKVLETEIDSLRHSLQSTTSELYTLSQQMEDLNFVRDKFEELNTTLSKKDKELEDTASALEERTRKLSEYKKFHKLKSEDVLRISHELEAITTSSGQKIAELEDALKQAQVVEQNLKKEVAELKETSKQTPESVDSKLQEQSLKMKKLAANIKLKAKLVKDLETKIEQLETVIQEKDAVICNLKLSNQQEKSSDEERGTPTSVLGVEEKCKSLEHELISLKEELNFKSEELESMRTTSQAEFNVLVQIKELENQNKKLSDISDNKSDQIRKMESEITDLSDVNKSLLSELEQMQESYKRDSTKNESLLVDFEKEISVNNQEVRELNTQLLEITSRYEQTWAKLQEKEGYIEELEQQLEKVKQRLLLIESTVEDRRRSLEEKTELLGARLCEAEKNNQQLELHEGELEQKIAMMLNTEEKLDNILQKLQVENVDLTKALSESIDTKVHITQELEKELKKNDQLTKELHELRTNVSNYDKLVEDYEQLKKQLIEAHEAHSIQVKWLETRLAESEQSTENETQRLLEKVSLVEAERQDLYNKLNSLALEKQVVEEELINMQQTIADLTNEELEQLRINHEHLSDQLTVELEKRQSYINRIQELEQMSMQNCERSYSSTEQEMAQLECKLEQALKENEQLKVELLKERAQIQVDNVLAKAQETYFTMTSPSEEPCGSANAASFFSSFPSTHESLVLETQKEVTEGGGTRINDKLATLESENQHLKSCLQELKSQIRNQPNIADSDDWQSKDEEDGWGWGSKDALLEHEHLQKQKINIELEAKIFQLETMLKSLNEDNARLVDELKVSQTKCSKLFKKLKEFKNKSDNLERSSRERSLGLDDLDLAMQEELKSQVEKLEKSLKECSVNMSTLQAEKEGFLKRIDVLTSANERLVEMKERQDIEVGMWQKRSSELQNKIQALEWTVAELNAENGESKHPNSSAGDFSVMSREKDELSSKALEMEEKCNALAEENEYLQSIIVELKDKNKVSTSKMLSTDQVETSQIIDQRVIVTQEENNRLKKEIQSLEERIKEISFSHDNTKQNSSELKNLLKENEELSSQLKRRDEISHEIMSKYAGLEQENSQLKATVLNLQLKVEEFELKNLEQKEEPRFSSLEGPVENLTTNSLATMQSEDSPALFRGFTNVIEDPFDFTISHIATVSNNVCELSKEKEFPVMTSSTVENVEPKIDGIVVGNLEHASSSRDYSLELHQAEIVKLNALSQEKDKELNYLKGCILNLEMENSELKQKMESKDKLDFSSNPTNPWESATSQETISEHQNIPSSCENLETLNRILQEKDVVIDELRLKLKSFFNEQDSFDDSTTNRHLSIDPMQSVEEIKNQVNNLNEQITQLTNMLQEKDLEIEQLNEKKKKYKDMYFALSKDYDEESPHPSNLEREQLTDQNVLLNQLLDDKETQLEIMSQQIDQTIVAKENLQDELSLKLHEIEAAKSSLSSPKLPKELLESSPPENIEEVKTLCGEISELTRLLQEKEAEVELLKQQLDELMMEKDTIIDELKGEVETLKKKLETESPSGNDVGMELEQFKESVITDLEKQYNDELSLKEQQLMNALNDLRNTHNYCKDLQTNLQDLEVKLKICNEDKEILAKKLSDANIILEDVDFEPDLSFIDKIKYLKANFTEPDHRRLQQTLETVGSRTETYETGGNIVSEQPLSTSHVKKFASEPFRISTEQSSSDDDSISRRFETVQGQTMLMNEIQSLKQVLTMKDSEITRLSIALNNYQEGLMKNEEEILRQRLDEALYTLHLRDVRCDELSLELMQLLEERDSLQLRLSTAIRFNEELREKSKLLDEAAATLEYETISSPTSDDSTSDNSQQLKQKLDQLHNVGYRRDPGLQQEQQRRHAEQMQLYTQSPSQEEAQQSSGFFGWLFGASVSNPQES